MNINPTATQPNFKAKVKNNDYMQGYINYASKREMKELKKSFESLNKVYPNDVLEITRDNKKEQYVVKNANKDTVSTFKATEPEVVGNMESTYIFDSIKPLSTLIQDIARVGSIEHNEVFGLNKAKKEPAQENKDKKELLDMLA